MKITKEKLLAIEIAEYQNEIASLKAEVNRLSDDVMFWKSQAKELKEYTTSIEEQELNPLKHTRFDGSPFNPMVMTNDFKHFVENEAVPKEETYKGYPINKNGAHAFLKEIDEDELKIVCMTVLNQIDFDDFNDTIGTKRHVPDYWRRKLRNNYINRVIDFMKHGNVIEQYKVK